MSVLAHVVLGGPQQTEPAATQALTYILNKSPSFVCSLIELLGDEKFQFEPGRVDAELSHEEGRPDLAIYDKYGALRVFVENKFWAGLTKAQPVFYLDKLPIDSPSALIFVVPKQRIRTVWNELKERCLGAKLEWSDQSVELDLMRASVDRKSLLVTSWEYLLKRLLDVSHSKGFDNVSSDISQLLGLTTSMNLDAFLPLRDEETNNQEISSRLINYIDLIADIVSVLESIRIIDGDHRGGATPYSRGRYMKFIKAKTMPFWFGVHLKVWRDEGISPMWCWFGTSTGVAITHFQKLPDLFKDVKSRGDGLYIPIRLKNGVEREKVVEHAVAQIEQIANEVISKSVN